MMKKWALLSMVWVLGLLLAGCGGRGVNDMVETPSTPLREKGMLSVLATPASSPLPTPTPFSFPTDSSQIVVAPGKATVIGRLLSRRTGMPLPGTVVRLAEVYYAEEDDKRPETGAYALDNAFSPSAITDEQGYFIFQDIEPRDYVIFVGDISVNYAVEVNEKGFPRARTVQADVVNNFGDVIIEFP